MENRCGRYGGVVVRGFAGVVARGMRLRRRSCRQNNKIIRRQPQGVFITSSEGKGR